MLIWSSDRVEQEIGSQLIPDMKLYLSVLDRHSLFFMDQVNKVNKIPKPKPKVEKPLKNETENSKEKADTTKSSSEEGTSQKEQTASEAEKPSADENSDHDEL